MSTAPAGLWPNQVAALYGIPPEWDGAGQCIGVVALGGSYRPDDLSDAMAQMRRPVPLVVPVSVPVNGRTSGYNGGTPPDEEVTLDVQALAAIVPAARIVVYCAPNSEDGMASAIAAALADSTNNPTVLSISYGFPEYSLTHPGFKTIESVLQGADGAGVSVVAAAGDFLADAGAHDGGAHVLYPASSEFVVACGGTQIELTPDGSAIAQETVWNDNSESGTDGGRSALVDVPDFQSNIALPSPAPGPGEGRGVPDVAAFAAKNPGYRIVLGGTERPAFGTSAATPLLAAIIALANAQRGQPLAGAVHRFLYANPQENLSLKPILQGNNRWQDIGYYAGHGWNACTGWGVPKGVKTITALAKFPLDPGT